MQNIKNIQVPCCNVWNFDSFMPPMQMQFALLCPIEACRCIQYMWVHTHSVTLEVSTMFFEL